MSSHVKWLVGHLVFAKKWKRQGKWAAMFGCANVRYLTVLFSIQNIWDLSLSLKVRFSPSRCWKMYDSNLILQRSRMRRLLIREIYSSSSFWSICHFVCLSPTLKTGPVLSNNAANQRRKTPDWCKTLRPPHLIPLHPCDPSEKKWRPHFFPFYQKVRGQRMITSFLLL